VSFFCLSAYCIWNERTAQRFGRLPLAERPVRYRDDVLYSKGFSLRLCIQTMRSYMTINPIMKNK
jgi:PIN domain nuclease of toxin-antitoxin system